MIQRDTAARLLEPLALPTLRAFKHALEQAEKGRAATENARVICGRPVLGMLSGVEFWAYFSSGLCGQYLHVPHTVRVEGGHKLSHAWIVSNRLRVQLKSDVAALDYEQLMIPGLEDLDVASPDVIVLTWSHAGAVRFDPAFVHLTPSGVAWRIAVGDLVASDAEPVRADVPRARVTSKSASEVDRDTSATNEAEG